MPFGFAGKWGGPPHGGNLGCGKFCSRFPSEYQPSLASWSQELQRRERELPSGQSPQFSPSALPFGHMPGWKRNKPEPEAAQDRLEDKLHLWERDPWPKFLAKLSDVEEACGRGENPFSPIVCSMPLLPPIGLFYRQPSVVRIPECVVIWIFQMWI